MIGKAADAVRRWVDETILDLGRQFRWSYLPPLMVYLAAGLSGLTAIAGTFFVKDYLGLSAAFLTALSFWVGLPWVMKMPLGHLVDLIWRWKAILVYAGAVLVAASIGIMYALIAHADVMASIMRLESWFVLSTLLAPTGYVIQDTVADAMTVEAVPLVDAHGAPFPDAEIKTMHTTMQALGRFAIISGFIAVATLNITPFEGVELLSESEKAAVYAKIYLMALLIPLISVIGVLLGIVSVQRRAAALRGQGFDEDKIEKLVLQPTEPTGGFSAAALSLWRSRS